MKLQIYKKYIYYLKSTGTCVVVVGGCWFLYQLRQTSQILRSSVTTNVLDLEQSQAQYIYIDDPRFKDVLMFRNKEDLRASIAEKPRTLTYIITKWWKSLNRNLAYKLLDLAQNGCASDREKAVYSLSRLKHLKDWHYWHMAQMLDAKTAVALARMPNVDLRFFLRPPYYHMKHKLYDVIENLHYLLLDLDSLCQSCHPCLTQFLNKKFHDTHRDGLIFDHDLTSVGLAVPPAIIWDQDLLYSCVQAIHHHSSLDQHSKDIVDAGGLPILMNVQKLVGDNINICILLAKIISNISLHEEYLNDLFRSGWIGILAKWLQNPDLRLSATAARALANLDIQDASNEKYARRIYVLHPLHRNQSARKLDVVFVHGLLGGVFVTWRQRDPDTSTLGFVNAHSPCGTDAFTSMLAETPQEFLKDLAHDLRMREWKKIGEDFEVILDDCPENTNCRACGPFTCRGDNVCMEQAERDRIARTECWPRDWLPRDVPSLRVIGINYDTNLSMWTPLCPIEGLKTTIDERSEEFVRKLLMAGVGKKPIVWICHSMGGLLVKKMLVEEWKQGDKHNLCQNTRSIVFYSTPHRGSHVAALTQTTQMLVWPSVEVQELREESPKLLQLHDEFIRMLKNYTMDIVSFSETKSTLVTALKFPFQFVNPNSADPGVGEFFEIPQDHLSICKPANRQSFLYQKVLSIVKRHVNAENNSSKKV
ncbi:protein SERAC1 isoform X2 [Cephus cinctus]|uniref:Protein SERAC1 n=1 Tax=Cephus cinctus TaxID=211228 RepID=A0AAJ7C1H2_CEPCN|nr:protein SERAC1 isoform X2 [Cephus cinctus]